MRSRRAVEYGCETSYLRKPLPAIREGKSWTISACRCLSCRHASAPCSRFAYWENVSHMELAYERWEITLQRISNMCFAVRTTRWTVRADRRAVGDKTLCRRNVFLFQPYQFF